MSVFHILGYWLLGLCAVGVTALTSYLITEIENRATRRGL